MESQKDASLVDILLSGKYLNFMYDVPIYTKIIVQVNVLNLIKFGFPSQTYDNMFCK